MSRLNQLNDIVTKAQNERVSKQTVYDQLKGADPNSDAIDNFPVIGANAGVVEAKSDLAHAASRSRRAWRASTCPEHPKMVEINTQGRQRQAPARRRADQGRREHPQRLQRQAVRGAQLLGAAPGAEGGGQRARQEGRQLQHPASARPTASAPSTRRCCTQQKELSVVANSRANNVQVMDRAEVPGAPILPNPRKDWITAILAGVTIALGLAFGIEYLDDTVKTPEDVTRRLKLPLLGPGAGGPRRPGAGADRAGAARLRRGVPLAAHLARLHQRRAVDADDRGHQQPAARGQDHHRVQPGDGARARRIARAADRRRHAPSRPAQDHGAAERHRPVAPAGRPGARARRRAAHQRAEPASRSPPDARRPTRRSCCRPSG